MANRKPAEVFPPGDFIKDELDARGWSQSDLAEITGRSPKEISDLVLAKRAISSDIANELSAAFGTTPDVWMNLETSYQLWKNDTVDDAIAKRAALYDFAPISEMVKRHWIEGSNSVAVLSQRVMQHFEIGGFGQHPNLRYATRKSTEETSSSHLAWLYRAKHLGRAVQAAQFSDSSLDRAMVALKNAVLSIQEIRRVPRVLSDAGIRFVVIEPLPKTKIDGAVLWLDDNSPVIALSLRYDRIDHFWFTLAHELAHIKLKHVTRGDGGHLDYDMFGQDAAPPDNNVEREADDFAASFLVNQRDLEDFIVRVRPLYAQARVRGFALTHQVHPGIVVGQLQHRQEVPWSAFRPLLEKVRHIVTATALTDGWGHVPQSLS